MTQQYSSCSAKLEPANAEIRSNQRLLALAEGRYQERVAELHEEIANLRTYIGRHLSQIDTVHTLLARHCETNERLLLANAAQTESLIQNLIRQSGDNQAVLEALTVVDQKLTAGVQESDEEAVKLALAVIQREKPTVFTRLHSVFLTSRMR